MGYKMRVTIDSDTLDISEWPGKVQRLTTAIEDKCKQLSEDDLLPYKLVMTMEQYMLLRNTREFGEKGQSRYYAPEDRIYTTSYNCLEVIIK
jgi:hypothetical protein